MASQFEVGFLVGLLVGEGHFGGDGRQPQITLRMHVRHEVIFQWLERTFPGGRLYGPYHHDGRHYLQWMARGRFLRDELVPLLDRFLSADLDRQSFERFQLMKARYRQLSGEPTSHPSRPRRSRPARRRDGTNSLLPNEDLADEAARAESNRGTFPRSRSSPEAAPDTGALAELFAELRETWPS